MTDKLPIPQPLFDLTNQQLWLPRQTLIVLCGPSGSGKTTFASTHFPLTAIVSTDNCRSLISDDARNMECTEEAFDLAYIIVNKRLKLGRTTVFDSTALTAEFRQKLREIAAVHAFKALLIVLQTPLQICQQRDTARLWPAPVGKEVLSKQYALFQESMQNVEQEGFDLVVVLDSNEVNKVQLRVR